MYVGLRKESLFRLTFWIRYCLLLFFSFYSRMESFYGVFHRSGPCEAQQQWPQQIFFIFSFNPRPPTPSISQYGRSGATSKTKTDVQVLPKIFFRLTLFPSFMAFNRTSSLPPFIISMAVMEFGQSFTSSQNPVVNLLTRVIYLHSLMQLLNETLEGKKNRANMGLN